MSAFSSKGGRFSLFGVVGPEEGAQKSLVWGCLCWNVDDLVGMQYRIFWNYELPVPILWDRVHSLASVWAKAKDILWMFLHHFYIEIDLLFF